MTEEMIPVSLNDTMNFECRPDISCFNDCCRDLNQFLFPYDILRLKNNLKLNSSAFLKKYTLTHFGPESGLPVVSLKFDARPDQACPFVTEQGCSVYTDRPASCRMYPLARAVSRSRKTGGVTEYYALIQEPHCKGFRKKGSQTVGEWLKGQEVAPYNRMNDMLMELISLKNRIMPGELEHSLAEKFYLCCYDLDRFKEKISGSDLLKGFHAPDLVLEKAETDDTTLLKLGLAWARYTLFGIQFSE